MTKIFLHCTANVLPIKRTEFTRVPLCTCKEPIKTTVATNMLHLPALFIGNAGLGQGLEKVLDLPDGILIFILGFTRGYYKQKYFKITGFTTTKYKIFSKNYCLYL